MLKSYERMCKCGCGSIINLNEDSYILTNLYGSRKSYYRKGCYIKKIQNNMNKRLKKYNLKCTWEEAENMLIDEVRTKYIEIIGA